MIYLLMKLKEQWTEKNIGVYKTYNQKKLRFTKIGVIKMITENVRKQLADYNEDEIVECLEYHFGFDMSWHPMSVNYKKE